MRVADLDSKWLVGAGAALGLALGPFTIRLADLLPRRHAIEVLVTGARRERRNIALVVAATACSTAIAAVLRGATELSIAHAAFLLVTNAVLASLALAAIAIDVEHMILPNELTLGAALLALLSSPLRSIGPLGAVLGAAFGLFLGYAPLLLYRRLRRRSGMGLGDVKLLVTAGAWHGASSVAFVLFLGALQMVLVAVAMRITGTVYETPESVRLEVEALRERAHGGDDEARRELDDDPMAARPVEGLGGTRLPFGPFLALACIELLFLRRWLDENVVAWLVR